MLTLAFPWFVMVGAGLLVLLPVGLYALRVYNELAPMRERLHALLGTVGVMRARRQAVGRAVQRHVGRSARHVEETVRRAARGKQGGRHTKVNMDGFPEQRLIDLAGRGMADDVRSCGMETEAQVTLRREAAAYNARLCSFPCCLIAPLLGFRLWKTHQREAKRQRWPGSRRPGPSRTGARRTKGRRR